MKLDYVPDFRRMIKYCFIVIAYLGFLTNAVNAQTKPESDKICGTVFYSGITEDGIDVEQEFEQWMREKVRELKSGNRTFNSYTIPVIFHVIHNGEPTGQGSNIASAKILANLEQLNLDFADQSGSMEESAADMQIQFCPALFSPDGQVLVEQGIHRVNRNDQNWSSPPYIHSYIQNVIKPNTIWNPNEYVNVWILSTMQAAYATYPRHSGLTGLHEGNNILFDSDTTAGIVMRHQWIGSKTNPSSDSYRKFGRALTHELGHYFGLIHLWGHYDNQTCNSDYCNDTPWQRDGTLNEHSGCPTIIDVFYRQNCPNMGDGNKRMFENYMDYTRDSCLNTFTLDQKYRAQVVMQNSPRRVSLATSNKCCEQPDLSILLPSVANPYTHPDSTIQVFFAVNNGGINDAPPHHVSFHLSTDGVLTPGSNGDTYIGEYFISQTLGGLSQTIMLNHSLVIPSNTVSGTYYLFFSADGGQVVDECNEYNNFATVIIHVSANPEIAQESWMYWFDNNYSNRILTLLAPGLTDYNIQNNLQTSFLPPGLHTLNFQFSDSNHVQSSIISTFFYKGHQTYPSGNARYQYWIDDFENHANTSIQSTNHFVLNSNIDLEELEDGLHTFNIRFKIDGKHWSSVSTSFFYKPRILPQDTAEYQYWVDDDFANAFTSIIPSSNHFVLLDSVDFASLTDGLHVLHARFRIDGKEWSSVESSFFVKNSLDPNRLINKCVYWFDDNYNDHFTVEFAGQPDVNALIQANVDELSAGEHYISVFFQDDEGIWSSIVRDTFIKTQNVLSSCPDYQRFVSGLWNQNNISYQWQANAGSGFINIQDGGVYSGTQTDTLILNDPPKSWYGNLYRCVVTTQQGSQTSDSIFLRFVYFWKGTENNAWENPSNWECLEVPEEHADVIINHGNVVVNSSPVISSLTTNSLSTITVQEGNDFHLTGHE